MSQFTQYINASGEANMVDALLNKKRYRESCRAEASVVCQKKRSILINCSGSHHKGDVFANGSHCGH